MQVIVKESPISIQEIAPTKFASLCTEAHAANRGKLAGYLNDIVEKDRGALFTAHDPAGTRVGRVCVEFNPKYMSRGKPCANFGWLDGTGPAAIEALLAQACTWASRQEVAIGGNSRRNTLLRGPVSFPKSIGGYGCQVEGFQMPRMYGIPTNRPELGAWIEAAGFTQDAPYACVDASNSPAWASAGAGPARSFQLVNFTPSEWGARREEIEGLVAGSFEDLLPDFAAGRFEEVLGTTTTHPNGKYYWPAALDGAGHLAGALVCIPNLWQAWNGHPVTAVNVDTIVIRPEYRGRGLFSALHDKGYRDMQAHCGITHFEGTAIWCANENAVKTIFPHCTLVRKHIVFQKRLKKRFNAEP